ncbi:MAG: protein kinase [Candidatus Aminicenantes bacterium]|nr:protein kinase [Candidatus Aminicenantes bacterium]
MSETDPTKIISEKLMSENIKEIGKYKIIDVLGKGAMGIVYKAMDPDIDRVVAIKAIRFDLVSEETDLDEMMIRFIREARSAGKLIHPNIATIYDVVKSENMTYIVMQYIEGDSLQKVISSGKKMPLEKAVHLIAQICDALDYAHKNGIIHRDIKPANILMDKEGTPYLVDFGIARVETSTITQTGRTVGTPSYMSPEQVMGKKVDKCSDIFSLGVLLYEILTGKRPFHGDSITTVIYKIINEEPFASTEIKKSLPSGFESIISKALQKEPQKRYQTCSQLKQELQAIAKLPIQETFKKPKKRWVRISAAAFVIILGTAAVLFFNQKINIPFFNAQATSEVTDESPLPPPSSLQSITGVPMLLKQQMVQSFENKDFQKTSNLAEDILSSFPQDKTAQDYLRKAQDQIQNKATAEAVSGPLNTGINQYNSGNYTQCINTMNQVLKLDPDNSSAKQYIYLADRAKSRIEINNILERQRKSEEVKDLESILSDIEPDAFAEQRKADLTLLFEHYQNIKSVYSDITIEFKTTREAQVRFSHMLIAVYKKTDQRKVLFDGVKTYTLKKFGNQWKIVDNK